MKNPRFGNCISINSLTHQTSSVARVNIKTAVCSNSGPTIAMFWIREAEIAKSVDDLMTSQSIEGRDFPDFEMLDAKIASALKRIISDQYFRRRVDVEEQTAQKYYRFLRGRQVAHMIYDHSRATSAHHAALDLSDLFNVSLQGDDHSGFRYKMGPSSIICKWNTWRECPGQSVQVEDTRFCSASDRVGHVWTRNWSRPGNAKLSKIEDCGKKTHWSDDQDAQLQSPEWTDWDKRISRESHREESQFWEESGRMLSVESNWTVFKKGTLAVSATGRNRGQRVQWSSPARRAADTDWRKITFRREVSQRQ